MLAPTGTAAALLNGTTYHAALYIGEFHGDKISDKITSQLRADLQMRDYIFLDEASMLSCRELSLIANRLCHILADLDTPFGGMNMILAGDFAQLPPVAGGEAQSLYSQSVGMRSGTSNTVQSAALGK